MKGDLRTLRVEGRIPTAPKETRAPTSLSYMDWAEQIRRTKGFWQVIQTENTQGDNQKPELRKRRTVVRVASGAGYPEVGGLKKREGNRDNPCKNERWVLTDLTQRGGVYPPRNLDRSEVGRIARDRPWSIGWGGRLMGKEDIER